MNVFQRIESQVRTYCRSWPVVFDRAKGCWLYDEDGRGYLDFFAGAGALNYGHNNPILKRALIDYIERDGVTHGLDMHTVAKRGFLEAFEALVLRPRTLDYTVMFPGPAGTNAVEAALKLARKVTGREQIMHFSNAFHGMTLGALSVTGNAMKRGGAGISLGPTTPVPYDDGATSFSLIGKPAAVIVETVQGEGGINVARVEWLRGLAECCRADGVLLIVDDVQMGCGRTGPFFSFEAAGITPDIVCLSKSIGGFGLPLALTLFRPELDIWVPGEHNGTFRGINPAFVAADTALRTYWSDSALSQATERAGLRVAAVLNDLADELPDAKLTPKGRGLARGLEFGSGALAGKVCRAAFERGLLVETAGPDSEVVKIMPPLTVSAEELDQGLAILVEAVHAVA